MPLKVRKREQHEISKPPTTKQKKGRKPSKAINDGGNGREEGTLKTAAGDVLEEKSAKVRDEEEDSACRDEELGELDELLGEDPAEVLFESSTVDPFRKEDLTSSETEEESGAEFEEAKAVIEAIKDPPPDNPDSDTDDEEEDQLEATTDNQPSIAESQESNGIAWLVTDILMMLRAGFDQCVDIGTGRSMNAQPMNAYIYSLTSFEEFTVDELRGL